MRGLSTLVLIAYDTAATAASWDRTRSPLDALWLRLDDVYRWCRDTATFAGVQEEHAGRVYWVRVPRHTCTQWGASRLTVLTRPQRYGTLMWATAIAIELSLVNLVDSNSARCTADSAKAGWPATGDIAELDTLSTIARRRVETQLCAYLPHTYGVSSRSALLDRQKLITSRVLGQRRRFARHLRFPSRRDVQRLTRARHGASAGPNSSHRPDVVPNRSG